MNKQSNNQPVTDMSIIQDAHDTGKLVLARNPANWPAIAEKTEVDIFHKELPSMIEGRDDLVAKMARIKAEQVQFPVDTAYVHGLAMVASAMCFNFNVKMFPERERSDMMHMDDDIDGGAFAEMQRENDEQRGVAPGRKNDDEAFACNAYIVTSQPAGAGKSSIHNMFSNPITRAFSDLNRQRAKRANSIRSKIEIKKKEKADTTEQSMLDHIDGEIMDLKMELEDLGPITYTTDDATPEALDGMSAEQGGFWTITSSEATAVETLLLGTYSNGNVNYNLMLKSWDSEYASTLRGSRKGNNNRVRGSIAVIAQDVSIQAVLKQAEKGKGISDRFLIFDEPDMFGERDHERPYLHMPEELTDEYRRLIHSIVRGEGALLTTTEENRLEIGRYMNKVEPHLRSEGLLGNPVVRGFYLKGPKHIMKLASILHVMKEWGDRGKRRTVISIDTVREAIVLFKKFGFVYREIADRSGVTGEKTEVEAVRSFFISHIGKNQGNFVKNEQLRSGLKNYAAFKSRKKVAAYIREKVLPELQEENEVFIVKTGVYINPKIIS